MKTLSKLILFTLVCVLAACASSGGSNRNSGMDGKREETIEYPGFLILTADDLNKLDAATRKNGAASELLLSDARKAACANQACEFLGAKNGVTATLDRQDLDEIRYLWNEAVSKSSPSTVIHGPVNLRCTPQQCNGDLYYRSHRPIEIKERGKVIQEGDPAGFFLPSFVQAIVKSGKGRN